MQILTDLRMAQELLFEQAKTAASVALIFEGARESALRIRTGYAMLLIGTLFVLANAIWSYVNYLDSLNIYNKFNVPPTQQLHELGVNWGEDLPPTERQNKTQQYASVVFINSGRLSTYFNQSSGWIPYCPTEKDIRLREENVVSREKLIGERAMLRNALDSSRRVPYSWFALAVISALMGRIAARRGH